MSGARNEVFWEWRSVVLLPVEGHVLGVFHREFGRYTQGLLQILGQLGRFSKKSMFKDN